MSLRDLFSEAMRNLGRRKLRTGLTVAGVVIGALAVVLIVSLSNGTSSFIDHHIRGVSNPNIVEAWQTKGLRLGKLADSFLGGLGQPPREIKPGNEEEFIGAFKVLSIPSNQLQQLREIEGVHAVRPFVFIMARSMEVMGDGREFDTIVSPWIQAGPVELIGGRKFGDDNATECIVSEAYLTSLGMNDPENLIGKRVRLHISEHPALKYIGQSGLDLSTITRIRESIKILQQPLKETGGIIKGIESKIRAIYHLFRDLNMKPPKGNGTEEFKVNVVGVARKGLLANLVYVPDDLAEKMGRVLLRNPKLFTPDEFGMVALLQVKNQSDIPRVKGEVKEIGLKPRSLEDHLGVMHRIFGMFQKILVVFGGIAFVVAAFSIVNTLLMSVMERKREIGVLQAVGATRGHIMKIFACEAAAIGLLGGLLGCLFGWLLAMAGNAFAQYKWGHIIGSADLFTMPVWLFPALLFFTMLLGLAAGVYPAYRASRLDPVAALRYE